MKPKRKRTRNAHPTLVLYSAGSQLTKEHTPCVIAGAVACWVRVEAHDRNLLDALDHARPRRGETVLNSIPAPLFI